MKPPSYYHTELNKLLIANDYSNEYLDSARDLIIEVKALPGIEYNSVKLKANRLERMLEAEWQSTTYQLYSYCLDHPGKANSFENYINNPHENLF